MFVNCSALERSRGGGAAILTGVLLTDEALLNRGGTFVCRRSQTQHLPLAGAALAHQKSLQAERRIKQEGNLSLPIRLQMSAEKDSWRTELIGTHPDRLPEQDVQGGVSGD